jgi:hypothetical protein
MLLSITLLYISCGVTSSVCRFIPTRLDLLHSREGNSQGSLNHVFLGRPYIAPCRSRILEWSWIRGWPGGSTCMLRWGRLTISCGPVGGPMVWRGAWDPGWFIGSMSPSLGHPSLLHPWYGGLVARWPVPRKLSRLQRLACLGTTGAMHTTPTNAVEVLIRLPPLELVVQSEARSAARCLWSVGSWSYLHPNPGHSSVLMGLQQLDPIF